MKMMGNLDAAALYALGLTGHVPLRPRSPRQTWGLHLASLFESNIVI